MAIRVLALLHGSQGTKRHSHQAMCIDVKDHRDVHSNNNHRWCIWHIMKKMPNKLNSYKRHEEIEQEMSHVVWNSYTKDAFDRNWNDFLTGYDLGGNKWLLELYEDRHIWIPVYLDHHFWARMRNTQRSESMHAFFDKFITRNSSQSQFVKQYDNCLASREQREREFDAADFHTVIPCATKSAIEVQFQHVYIHKKFREVQGQFRGKVNCITRSMHSTLGFTTYEVVEQVSNSKFNKFFVTYDVVSRELNLLDGGPTIQSSSSFYNAPDMNYTR
ncbi:protein FAR1-RELATED SEQUENCE 5-like [Arachis ipaensis]|uniref:protein FAR1-RELATED SEQUENCE 5-like n=1 Tax=Arachis ipaensis TaxID=130454 RepID=UPI0007AF9050|nr:protein FAR1-RELATED SEQUENCE 5-like [Arachis ipaensis]